jgi:thiol-disulfide isomerase/thioredoxin
MPKLITLLHFGLLLLGFWSCPSWAAPPDAVVRGLPGTSRYDIYYHDIYLASKSGPIRPGSVCFVHFNENSYSPALILFPIVVPPRKLGYRQPPPGQFTLKPPTLLVMPGDTVDILFNERQYAFEFRGRHQAELDFCYKVWQSSVSLDSWFSKMDVPHSKVPLDQFLRDWSQLKRTSEALIAELQRTPDIRPEVASLLTQNLRLRVFQSLLLPASYQRTKDPLRVLTSAYVDSVTAGSGILTVYERRAPTACLAGLPSTLSAYSAYQCLRAGRQPIVSARYTMAKQIYQGFQRAWACHYILETAPHHVDIRRLLADYQTWVAPYTEFVRALKGDPTVPMRSYQREVFTDSLDAQAGPAQPLAALLSQHKGRVVLLDMWASWCAPCLEELPASAAVAKRYQAQGLTVLYLSIDRDAAAWSKALGRLRGGQANHFRFANPVTSRFLREFELGSVPRYLVLDRTGAVRSPDAIRPSDERFAAFIEGILASP